MRPLVVGLVLFVMCGGLVPSYSAVRELSDNSFQDYAKDKEVLLVEFYAPWCCDCKKLDPELEAAAASLGKRSVDIAKFDCTVPGDSGKAMCDKYGIKEWPTLKYYKNGQYMGTYTGGLTANEIAGYVNTLESSVSPPVENPYAASFTG